MRLVDREQQQRLPLVERREAIERVAHAELLGRDVHELKVASERELISDIWGEWGVTYGGNGYHVHELKVASERELISDIWGEWECDIWGKMGIVAPRKARSSTVGSS